MKNIISIILFFSVLAVTSCAPSLKMTRGENYPNMYKEKPTSIVIMPPINRTDNVEAKNTFTLLWHYLLQRKDIMLFLLF